MRTSSLLHFRLQEAASFRCGPCLPVQSVKTEACDLPHIWNAAVPAEPANLWQSTSGAVAKTEEEAHIGAIAEALERYAAALCPFAVYPREALPKDALREASEFALFTPEQYATPHFNWKAGQEKDDLFAKVFRLLDNRTFFVPQEFVGLGPRQGRARFPSTSSGLAAFAEKDKAPWTALLRATEEILERDALAATWLNALPGREVAAPLHLQQKAAALGGFFHVFDLTQTFNPHPVIAILGGVPRRGKMRHALGIACRASYEAALEKAYLEWAQGLTFAGYLFRTQEKIPEAKNLRRFEEHAAFYTAYPHLFSEIPLVNYRKPWVLPKQKTPAQSASGHLETLVKTLAASGVELFYRELTTPDVQKTGLRVMRVLSPQLSLLHADESAPFLGGRTQDVAWRYGDLTPQEKVPNPLPHPLG